MNKVELNEFSNKNKKSNTKYFILLVIVVLFLWSIMNTTTPEIPEYGVKVAKNIILGILTLQQI